MDYKYTSHRPPEPNETPREYYNRLLARVHPHERSNETAYETHNRILDEILQALPSGAYFDDDGNICP